MSILIVEDTKYERTIMKDVLQKAGHKDIVTAVSANHAFEILGLNGKPPVRPLDVDCILMDLVMPDVDGIEACKRIRDCDCYLKIPIIMVTAMHDGELVKHALEAGANEYVKKPINDIELTARVSTILKLKKEKDELEKRQFQLGNTVDILKRSNEELKELIQFDSLTGVPTKVRFEQQFCVEWRRAMRNKTPLALIMLDIDYFKAFNKHYLTKKGDVCLKEVAKRLKAAIKRPADLLVRYGDDDFAIMLPDTDQKGALIVAEGLKKAIKEMAIANEKSLVSKRLTISIGVAAFYPSEKLNPSLMIEGALKALENAKLGGRNLIKSVAIAA